MKNHHTIKYQVHPTPMKEGDTVQTYHVRRSVSQVIHTNELAEHIQQHTMIDRGLLELVMERLKMEIVEHLLDNKDVHLDGIGRFSLSLGTKLVRDSDDGPLHRKTYTEPDALTAREVVVDGVTFVPDKTMLGRLLDGAKHFERVKRDYQQDIPRATLLTKLADYCATHGSFTRNAFQRIFGVSRYRAQQMLDDLVSEPYPKYYRVKAGPAYIYRKTGT